MLESSGRTLNANHVCTHGWGLIEIIIVSKTAVDRFVNIVLKWERVLDIYHLVDKQLIFITSLDPLF